MFDKTLITPLNIPAAIEKLLKNASELKSSFPKKNSDQKKKKKNQHFRIAVICISWWFCFSLLLLLFIFISRIDYGYFHFAQSVLHSHAILLTSQVDFRKILKTMYNIYRLFT